jgi:hypothetical protein
VEEQIRNGKPAVARKRMIGGETTIRWNDTVRAADT